MKSFLYCSDFSHFALTHLETIILIFLSFLLKNPFEPEVWGLACGGSRGGPFSVHKYCVFTWLWSVFIEFCICLFLRIITTWTCPPYYKLFGDKVLKRNFNINSFDYTLIYLIIPI